MVFFYFVFYFCNEIFIDFFSYASHTTLFSKLLENSCSVRTYSFFFLYGYFWTFADCIAFSWQNESKVFLTRFLFTFFFCPHVPTFCLFLFCCHDLFQASIIILLIFFCLVLGFSSYLLPSNFPTSPCAIPPYVSMIHVIQLSRTKKPEGRCWWTIWFKPMRGYHAPLDVFWLSIWPFFLIPKLRGI